MSRRFQFSLKTMLWVTALVGALLGGREIGVRQERRGRINQLVAEQEKLRDDQLRLRNQLQWIAQEQMKLLESESPKERMKLAKEVLGKIGGLRFERPPFETLKSKKRSPKRRPLEETLDKVDGQRRFLLVASYEGTELGTTG